MVPMMLQLEPTSSGIMHTESKGKGGERQVTYDERILTSIAILREKHNLGTCEV